MAKPKRFGCEKMVRGPLNSIRNGPYPKKGNVFLVRNLANLRYVDYNGEASGNIVEGITDSVRTSGPR
jgi:hypothetical protein